MIFFFFFLELEMKTRIDEVFKRYDVAPVVKRKVKKKPNEFQENIVVCCFFVNYCCIIFCMSSSSYQKFLYLITCGSLYEHDCFS